eukprot:TRINITY_DN40983_c0_g1_i1.p1 TRINITY_DN40983_c0_g1~~TRINITY_DN40983_c0_g1_i1.p1  ORF type:complete len:461 (-),score=2.93 TRINITY_DN40983_c0_g1_i1:131-1471(-)
MKGMKKTLPLLLAVQSAQCGITSDGIPDQRESTIESDRAGWRCRSDAGCQLNGVCNDGQCDCFPQWAGANCSSLRLGTSLRGYAGRSPRTSTWGGHPVKGDDGFWHLYAAEMTQHCTLADWISNSETVHATSASPTGPFKFKEVVQVPWSHNPVVAREPSTGDFLIAHIGCGSIDVDPPRNCSEERASSPRDHAYAQPSVRSESFLPPCRCPKHGKSSKPTPCQTLQVLRSKGPSGPWVDKTVAWPLNSLLEWPGCLSNPSLLFGDNGSVLLGFNGNLAPPNNHGPTSKPGLLHSSNGVEGPYAFVNGSGSAGYFLPTPNGRGFAEDSVLYRDRNGYPHMLIHGFYDEFPGGHGWTTDKSGLTGWEFSTTAAYGFDTFLDGKEVRLRRRERPQVVLNANGDIEYLWNGAEAYGEPHSFTMVTLVCNSTTSCPARQREDQLHSGIWV